MLKFNVYLCPDPWKPLGVCSPLMCENRLTADVRYRRVSSVRVSLFSLHDGVTVLSSPRQHISTSVKRMYITQPIAHVNSPAGKKTLMQYIFPEGVTSAHSLIGRVCRNWGADRIFPWKRDGDTVTAEIPLPAFCGLKYIMMNYGSYIRYYYPAAKGEITSRIMKPASGDYYPETYSETSDILSAGEIYPVWYKSRAVNDIDHFLGFFRFETALLTTAEIAGCGIFDGEKFVQGGEGYSMQDIWSHQPENIRWLVRYRNVLHNVQPSDFRKYGIGEKVYIAKNALKGDVINPPDLDESCITDRLDELAMTLHTEDVNP
jgi:hypothetical protein